MKRFFIVFALLVVGIGTLYSQNLPSWVRVGMTKTEILQRIDDWIIPNEIYDNMENPNLFGYSNKNWLTVSFNVDPVRGLEQVFISGGILNDLSFSNTISDFTNRYGQPRIRSTDIYYFNRNLPNDVEMIMVTRIRNIAHQSSNDSAEVVYFLRGTFYIN